MYTVYFETYGCQMNQNDTDIAWSVLKGVGYTRTMEVTEVSYTCRTCFRAPSLLPSLSR